MATSKTLAMWIICGVGVLTTPKIARCNDARAAAPPADIALRSQFANLEAITFGARVTATLYHEIPGSGIPVGEPIEGFFEYQCLGNRWRRMSTLDERMYPGMNTVAGYDGSVYSYEMRDRGVVSVSFGGPERSSGMTLPNPILELGRFCAHSNDVVTDLLMKSVRAGAKASPAPLSVTTLANGAVRVQNDGGVVNTQDTTITMEFGIDGLLHRIERRATDTRILLSVIECADYRSFSTDTGRDMMWPTTVTFTGMDPVTGKPGGTIQMNIEWLSLRSNAVDARSFSPDWDGGSRIWIDELGLFIK